MCSDKIPIFKLDTARPRHVARRVASETENGNVAVQVAVEDAAVPASGEHCIVWSPAVCWVTRKVTTVPTGMLDAAMFTVTGPLELI